MENRTAPGATVGPILGSAPVVPAGMELSFSGDLWILRCDFCFAEASYGPTNRDLALLVAHRHVCYV